VVGGGRDRSRPGVPTTPTTVTGVAAAPAAGSREAQRPDGQWDGEALHCDSFIEAMQVRNSLPVSGWDYSSLRVKPAAITLREITARMARNATRIIPSAEASEKSALRCQ
jgi:hypothetical protein